MRSFFPELRVLGNQKMTEKKKLEVQGIAREEYLELGTSGELIP